MAENNTTTLPSMRRNIFVDIAELKPDLPVPDAQKLPILVQSGQPAALNQVNRVAAHWAFKQFQDPIAKQLLVNGVFGLIKVGMICTIDNIPDGSWKKIDSYAQIDENEMQAVSNIINLDMIKRAITVTVATKANFWQTNNYTGHGTVQEYVKKDLEVFYSGNISDELLHAARSLGRFASTVKVLQVVGLQNLREAVPFVCNSTSWLTLSDDVKLRFQSMPAGTQRLAVAFEAAKRLIRSKYAMYCPRVQDFQALAAIRNQIIADPVRYHISAAYLTGQPRAEYTDVDVEVYLGRLGTFISTLYSDTTLAKSPYMQPAKVRNYEDYDVDFYNFLTRIQKADNRGSIIKEEPTAVDVTPEVIKYLREVFLPYLDWLTNGQLPQIKSSSSTECLASSTP